jgi:hypothetical protein
LSSVPGEGTTVNATFRLSHPDCKPMGDIGLTMQVLVTAHPGIDFLYEHKKDNSTYCFDSRETDKK